ncbi:3-oxo-isoapionate kinase OiaK [Paraburkholderia gardini]|uniref:3-oxo-isoapionate kinase n=1 Tax=Paraburkholderia gardini TaxID=2823469 RepID=A0ABM8U9H4_9BURK|nr:3-oxo-isoapionate kinase OiaK [Paraburkholderia gardini]CAG4894239.1 3-oxo-isoapionate kinase [Paraburkholderia gardini]CAG4917963.1 3-oxo-isoapionate kinase [Paraburkholderia gardini]
MNGTSEATWPDGLLLAYYGDDFTGSTDAMEAMSAAGVPTVLCLQQPTRELLARFPEVRCVGMAGSSRGRSTTWMDDELPEAFASLAALGAPILQYKVCSTFDSSPEVGSIGRAIDIGVKHMPGSWSPMVVGAPRLKRYQMFGNLFAAVDGAGYRLDRHPTMSRHPVTPMNEADLRLHLARQTARRIELIDMIQLRGSDIDTRVRALSAADTPVALIDVLDEETLAAAGRLIWEQRGEGIFTAASSGLQYALAAYWRACGLLPPTPSLPVAGPVQAIAVASGSCSPVTAAQIGWARAHGFHAERLDLHRALDPRDGAAEIERVVTAAGQALTQGISTIVHSAEGPDDPAVTGFDAIASSARLARHDAARMVGHALAEVMRRLLDRFDLPRVVVAGGDSSGEVAGALGIDALSVVAGLAPGAPLCRAWSAEARRDGLQIVLKGGQLGDAAFFGAVREGRVSGA